MNPGRKLGRCAGCWLLLLVLLVALLPARARAQPPEQARGWWELAVTSSIRGPLGPAALAVAVRPVPAPRWAVGFAFGHSPSQSIWGHENDPRWGLFLRCDIVSEPRYRLGAGFLYSKGSYYWPGTPSATGVAYWYWFGGERLDLTVAAELVHGNLALRLEGGVGRMLADPTNVNNGPQGSPPRWFPVLQLAVAVRPGTRPPDAAEPAPAPRNLVRLFVAGTPLASGSAGCDCAYEYHARYDMGLEAEVLRQVSAHWRLGVGGRFYLGHGVAATGAGQTAIVGFVPFLLAPFYRWDRTGEELELAFGFGPSFGEMEVSGGSDDAVDMTGVGAEAALSYSRPLAGAVSLVVGITARLLLAGGSELHGTLTSGRYASLPLRLGVSW
jgi:hypothetical protein